MILEPLTLIAAGLALIYGAVWCWNDSTGRARSVVKTGAVALLALAGARLGAAFWVVLGLGLGALGDYFLSRPGKPAFLAGMAAFGAGHLAYVAYLAGLWSAPHWVPMLGVVVLGISTELWLSPHTGGLRGPVRAYVVVICAMGLMALGQSAPLLLWGAGLFILSDLLLALARFVLSGTRWASALSLVLWPAYWIGQFLILQGALWVP